MCMAAKSHCRIKSSVFANSASVSPGKATIKSVVMAQPGEILPQQADALQIPGRVIPAIHASEYGVTPRLEREVELGAEIGKALEPAAQRLVDDAGLQRAEADAGLRNGGQDGLEQVTQGAAVVPFRAPGGDLDAGDDDLPVAILGQGRGLGHGICPGAASAPGLGQRG